ncbi:hypothetical protein [Streptomyces sp. NBC_01538]|uniref:hypothetical protein n=1 Tax=Streptomyces sp. NBC_01538 TaxID=2903897 RepID=UPI00386C05B1
MDSVTTVALIGVAGTVAASLAGVGGAVRAAGVDGRSRSALEESKARRAAYGACAAALLVQRDAVLRLMDVLNVPDLDEERARERVVQAQVLHDDVGTTVGAVVIEGPEEVADAEESASQRLGAWLDELAWWLDLRRRSRWSGSRLRAVRRCSPMTAAVASGG